MGPGDRAQRGIVVADIRLAVRVFDSDLKSLATFGTAPDTTKTQGRSTSSAREMRPSMPRATWVTDTGNDRIQVFTLGASS
jgi:hypothetical protein